MSQTVASYADYTLNAVFTCNNNAKLDTLYLQCNFLLSEMANVIYFLYRTICTYNYVHMVIIMPYMLTEQEPGSV